MASANNNKSALWLKKLPGFLGPGFLVTVGFVDPGNWATNIEGGSRFGYELLWVVTLSTVMLILIQHMAAKLGIATGSSLAVNIRQHFPKPVTALFGTSIMLACIATDVAELLGGAIGFSLLLAIPIWVGALFTATLKVFLIISQRYHRIESIIVGFLAIITLSYLAELFIVKPEWSQVLPALVVPKTGRESIYVTMAILGALVMPHNIFLHSNIIHSRKWGISEEEKLSVLRYEKIDTIAAMTLGWLVNSAMIIVAAAVFFRNHLSVGSIEEASATLKPIAGPLAGLLFSVALLFSGVGSSITSAMAEANVITGFLAKAEDPRSPFYRVAVIAIAIPSLLIILLTSDTFRLLILSQVVLGLQLPLTLLPLLILSRSRRVMGAFRSSNPEFAAALLVSVIVVALNIFLFYITFN